MNKDFAVEHFAEIDGHLYTIKKWSRSTRIGKTSNKVYVNEKLYKNGDVLWILKHGEIPEGMTVKNGELISKTDVGGRPYGSKSKNKRKNILSMKEERELVSNYSSLSAKEILSIYNISKSQLLNIRRKYGLKPKNISSILIGTKTIQNLMGVCGIYAIARDDNSVAYIGSSKNIGKRIETHIRYLSRGSHINRSLQEDWPKSPFYFYLIKECDEMDLLKEEENILDQFDKYCYYNKTFNPKHDVDYKILYDLILSDCSITNNGCIEYNRRPRGNGYVWIRYTGISFQTHRVAYFAAFGETSNLINHKCHNKKCCNPEHLSEESHYGNSMYSISAKERGSKSSLYKHKDAILDLVGKKSYREIIKELDLDISVAALSRFLLVLRGGVL